MKLHEMPVGRQVTFGMQSMAALHKQQARHAAGLCPNDQISAIHGATRRLRIVLPGHPWSCVRNPGRCRSGNG